MALWLENCKRSRIDLREAFVITCVWCLAVWVKRLRCNAKSNVRNHQQSFEFRLGGGTNPPQVMNNATRTLHAASGASVGFMTSNKLVHRMFVYSLLVRLD